MPAKTSVCSDVSSPLGSGRRRVRAISASIFCSTRQLNAAAAPATSAMPTVANSTTRAGGKPGVARNMPITAQNTISDTTRGLVSARNCRSRVSASASVVKRCVSRCGRDCGSWRPTRQSDRAILPSAAAARQPIRDALSRRVRSLAMPLMSGSSRVAQHEVAERVDEVERSRARRELRGDGVRDARRRRGRDAARAARATAPRRRSTQQDPHDALLLLALHRSRLPRRVERGARSRRRIAAAERHAAPSAAQLVEPERRAVRPRSLDARRSARSAAAFRSWPSASRGKK